MRNGFCIWAMLLALLLPACKKVEPFVYRSDYDLSVMSFNLRYDEPADGKHQWSNRKEAIIKMFRETQPSVFGIQEGLHHMVNYLDENLAEYSYVGLGRDDGHSSGEYNAIFYHAENYELLESNTFWLSETPDVVSMGWDAVCYRIVTWVKLKNKETEKEFFVFNTHFDHKGKTAQRQSGKLLVKKVKEIAGEDAPVIITGDLNVLIRNKALKPIVDNYFSSRRFANHTDNKQSFNFFGKWPLKWNIDFIFYKNAHALAFRTITEDFGVPYISDHYPILTHFSLAKSHK
jgi:endonuclease/exonuclease/phosphatase family metal-dependent hydrolase